MNHLPRRAIELRVLVQQLRAPNITAQARAADRASEWLREHGLDLADLLEGNHERQLPILRRIEPDDDQWRSL